MRDSSNIPNFIIIYAIYSFGFITDEFQIDFHTIIAYVKFIFGQNL